MWRKTYQSNNINKMGRSFKKMKLMSISLVAYSLFPMMVQANNAQMSMAGLLTEGSGGMAEDSEGVPSFPSPYPCESRISEDTGGLSQTPEVWQPWQQPPQECLPHVGSSWSSLGSLQHWWLGSAGKRPTSSLQLSPLPPAASSLSLPLFCILDSRGSFTCITSSCFELK